MKFKRRDKPAKTPRRPPHGGRGLKYSQQALPLKTGGSAPTRGPWIEIFKVLELLPRHLVGPHTGAVD